MCLKNRKEGRHRQTDRPTDQPTDRPTGILRCLPMNQIPAVWKIRTKSQCVLRTPVPPAPNRCFPASRSRRSQVPAEHPEARLYSRPLGGPRQGPLRPSGPGSVGAGSLFRRSRCEPGRAPAVGALSRREASSCRRLADRLPFVLDLWSGPAAINGLGTRRWPISVRAPPSRSRRSAPPRSPPLALPAASTRAPLRSRD